MNGAECTRLIKYEVERRFSEYDSVMEDNLSVLDSLLNI
jgi:hypothetical protein